MTAHLPQIQRRLWLAARGVQQRQRVEAPRRTQRPRHLLNRRTRPSRDYSRQPRRVAELHEQLYQQRVDAVQQLHSALVADLSQEKEGSSRASVANARTGFIIGAAGGSISPVGSSQRLHGLQPP